MEPSPTEDLTASQSAVRRIRHDLIGRLNTVSGFLELMTAGRTGELNPKQIEYIAHMQSEVDAAIQLADALMPQRSPRLPSEAPDA